MCGLLALPVCIPEKILTNPVNAPQMKLLDWSKSCGDGAGDREDKQPAHEAPL